MSVELVGLLRELRAAFETSDAETKARFQAVETAVNDVYKRLGRPGANDDGPTDERKSAVDFCKIRKQLTTPKIEGDVVADYQPGPQEIEEAIHARRGLRSLFRKRDPANLDALERKSLSSFSFGSNEFLLPPTWSDRVLSCLVDPSDIAGLMEQAVTSTGSLRFLIDSARIDAAGWACDASCFANNPQPDLQAGLGEMEIKAETLRYVLCAGQDLLADASFNVEQWALRKVADAFLRAVNDAVTIGTGIGQPIGVLNPGAGIPICDTAVSTPPGQFSWQDLVMLRMEIPLQWQAGASYLMNQRTFALMATMSDTTGRPLIGTLQDTPGFSFMGVPINIVSQFPDVAPGATPIGYGDWRQAYTVLTRQGVTMVADPFSAGWCTLFKFSMRIGGAPTCANAARLLRVR